MIMTRAETVTEVEPEIKLPIEADLQIEQAIVDHVRANGDALDVLQKPLKRYRFHNVIRAGTLTTAAATGLIGSWEQPQLQHVLYGGVAMGIAEGSRRISQYRTAKRIDKHLANQQKLEATTDEPLELLRTSSRRKSRRQLNLLWNAAFDPEETPGKVRTRLGYVAQTAKQSNVAEVVIPAETLRYAKDKSYVDEEAGEPVELEVSSWLKSTKKLPIGQLLKGKKGEETAEREVVALTPDECLKLAEAISQTTILVPLTLSNQVIETT
jgi:hypothetical protein